MDHHSAAFLRRWRRCSPALRAGVIGCFAAGFFAHLFAFTNILPNPDGISRVYDAQQMTVSGRWFLHYASLWHGYVQAPAVIGFFSLVFLALAAGLTVSLLQIKSPLAGGLCGVIMAIFPATAYTFLYLFTASAYFFGLLLAVLSVWLAVKYRFGWLFGAPLLACALGTYQAYLAAAAALALLWLMLQALGGTRPPRQHASPAESGTEDPPPMLEKRSAKELLFAGLRLLGLLALGLALYFGILFVFLRAKGLTLLDYKGISDAASTVGNPFAGLFSAYEDFVGCFFLPQRVLPWVTPVTVVLHVLLEAAGLWAFVRLIRQNGCTERPAVFGLILLLCLLLPPFCNLTFLLGRPMPIMRYALVYAYALMLALVDRAFIPPAGNAAGLRGGEAFPSSGAARHLPLREEAWLLLPKAGAYLAAAVLCVGFFQTDNLVYTISATAHRATESFATRLVERVESTPGYQTDMDVLIVGGFPEYAYYSGVEIFSQFEDYSDPSSSVLPLNKHVYYYLNDWLNVPWREPAEEELIALSESAFFRAMPLYPSDGSVAIENGRVVVKLAERYTPKADYELQYENRR